MQAARGSTLRRKSRAAFTILEVALAAAIMAMGISTSITVMQRGFAMLDSARNLTTAGQILVSQMETLRMYDWTTVAAYPRDEATTIDIATVFTGDSSVGSRFALTRTVTAESADLLRITFTVSWHAYDGHTVTRSMMTNYAHYGIHDYYYNHSS